MVDAEFNEIELYITIVNMGTESPYTTFISKGVIMFILAIAAALSSTAPHTKASVEDQQVMGANSGDIFSMEYEFAAGDSRRFVRSPDTYAHPSIKPKKPKRTVTLVPKANPLADIIARIKRENNIKTKS